MSNSFASKQNDISLPGGSSWAEIACVRLCTYDDDTGVVSIQTSSFHHSYSSYEKERIDVQAARGFFEAVRTGLNVRRVPMIAVPTREENILINPHHIDSFSLIDSYALNGGFIAPGVRGIIINIRGRRGPVEINVTDLAAQNRFAEAVTRVCGDAFVEFFHALGMEELPRRVQKARSFDEGMIQVDHPRAVYFRENEVICAEAWNFYALNPYDYRDHVPPVYWPGHVQFNLSWRGGGSVYYCNDDLLLAQKLLQRARQRFPALNVTDDEDRFAGCADEISGARSPAYYGRQIHILGRDGKSYLSNTYHPDKNTARAFVRQIFESWRRANGWDEQTIGRAVVSASLQAPAISGTHLSILKDWLGAQGNEASSLRNTGNFCQFVMAGLVPAIHVLNKKTWMPATSAGMTMLRVIASNSNQTTTLQSQSPCKQVSGQSSPGAASNLAAQSQSHSAWHSRFSGGSPAGGSTITLGAAGAGAAGTG